MKVIEGIENGYNEIILEKVRRVKHVALDMDGTIYNGGTLFPFTIGFFR